MLKSANKDQNHGITIVLRAIEVPLRILVPTKVTRTTLQNAASIAGLVITTAAMVVEVPKKEKAMGGGHGGGTGGMEFEVTRKLVRLGRSPKPAPRSDVTVAPAPTFGRVMAITRPG